MKISAYCICFNAEKTIARAIESMIEQSDYLQQIVIVDDCSTDKSWEIISSYTNYPNIEILNLKKNHGAVKARNIAVSKCTGDWIAVLDADDYWLKDKIKFQVDLISRHKHTTLVTTGSVFDSHCDLKMVHNSDKVKESKIKNLTNKITPVAHSSFLFNKSVFEKIGGYDERFARAHDFKLMLDLKKVGGHYHLSTIFTRMSQSPAGLTKTPSTEGFMQQDYALVAKYLTFAGLSKKIIFDACMQRAAQVNKGFNNFHKVKKLLKARSEDVKLNEIKMREIIHGVLWYFINKFFPSYDLIKLRYLMKRDGME